MLPEGIRNVTYTLSRACAAAATAIATMSNPTRIMPRGTRRLCRKLTAAHEIASMARKKRRSRLRPKAPSRVRRSKKKKAGARSHHYAELIGLALVAFGVFLATVLYGGWNAGVVGGRLTIWARGARGRRCLRHPGRLRERRWARSRAEPARRRPTLPPGPRRHVARPAARARRRARRLPGDVARGSVRLAARFDGRAHSRHVHAARGAAPAHGRLGRRASSGARTAPCRTSAAERASGGSPSSPR